MQSDLATALNAIVDRLDTQQSQNGTQVTLLTNIRDALGQVSQPPANYTIKQLLAQMIECLCETVPPWSPQNEPPANCTPESGLVRLQNFRLMGQQTINSAAHDIYYVEVTYTPPEPYRVLTSGGGPGVEGVLAAYGSLSEMVIAHNWAGVDRPTAIFRSGYNISLQQGTVEDALPDFSGSHTPIASDEDCFSFVTDDTCSLGDMDYDCYFLWVAWPAGATPSPNMWLGANNYGCAS